MKTYVLFIVVYIQCIFADNLYEGDECKLSYNEQGICVRLSLCPSAMEMVKQNQHPQNCGFIRSIPIVCCSKTQAKFTSLAEQKCKSFQKPILGPVYVPYIPPPNKKPLLQSLQPNQGQNNPTEKRDLISINPQNNNQNFGAENTASRFYSGIQQRNIPIQQNFQIQSDVKMETPPLQHSPSITSIDRKKRQTDSEESDQVYHKFVIGGENASNNEFPHMAALGYTNGNKIVWLCGGSLVSKKYVLTAAHCLYSKDFGPLNWVRLGGLSLTATTADLESENYKVIRKIPHPLYTPPSVYNDIALVELERLIDITSYVKPACLFTQQNIPLGADLVATGWGLTKVGGNQSDILQKVNLDLFTEDECDKSYKSIASTRRLRNGIIHKQQVCVGGKTKEKDTCQGDSGGPLQIRINDADGDRFYIVGVTSFGRSCGFINIPGIYTRVAFYVSWIESVLWPND